MLATRALVGDAARARACDGARVASLELCATRSAWAGGAPEMIAAFDRLWVKSVPSGVVALRATPLCDGCGRVERAAAALALAFRRGAHGPLTAHRLGPLCGCPLEKPARAVRGEVLRAAERDEVFDAVVAGVFVAVMNVDAPRDRPVNALPHRAVHELSVAVLIVAAAVPIPSVAAPFDRLSHASSIAPSGKHDNDTKPFSRVKTGCLAVPRSDLPSSVLSSHTSAESEVRHARTTARGPDLVATIMPGRMLSIGTSPEGVVTMVPATRHSSSAIAASCCGPRSWSGSSAL